MNEYVMESTGVTRSTNDTVMFAIKLGLGWSKILQLFRLPLQTYFYFFVLPKLTVWANKSAREGYVFAQFKKMTPLDMKTLVNKIPIAQHKGPFIEVCPYPKHSQLKGIALINMIKISSNQQYDNTFLCTVDVVCCFLLSVYLADRHYGNRSQIKHSWDNQTRSVSLLVYCHLEPILLNEAMAWWHYDMGTLSAWPSNFEVNHRPVIVGFLYQRARNEALWWFLYW